MTELELISEEISIQADIAEGIRARMATQDNGYQKGKLICVTRTLDRLKREKARLERTGELA
jgi:hypothetical protein